MLKQQLNCEIVKFCLRRSWHQWKLSLLLCTAIYSGDYKWFETESEEELESDSPTGSPSRDRSPSPNEPEGDRAETKETGDKGMLLSLQILWEYWTKTCCLINRWCQPRSLFVCLSSLRKNNFLNFSWRALREPFLSFMHRRTNQSHRTTSFIWGTEEFEQLNRKRRRLPNRYRPGDARGRRRAIRWIC